MNFFGLWSRSTLSFFLRRVHFVHCNGSWTQSVAQNSFAVFTRFRFLFVVVFVLHRTIRNLRFTSCVRIVSNSSVWSRCVIVCEQNRTSSMVMPAWRSRGIDRVCLLFSCGAERAPHTRRGRVRMCCVQFYVGLHGHQGLCCTCSARDIARYFQCDVQFFGVQFVLSIAIVPFGAQDQLPRSRDKG